MLCPTLMHEKMSQFVKSACKILNSFYTQNKGRTANLLIYEQILKTATMRSADSRGKFRWRGGEDAKAVSLGLPSSSPVASLPATPSVTNTLSAWYLFQQLFCLWINRNNDKLFLSFRMPSAQISDEQHLQKIIIRDLFIKLHYVRVVPKTVLQFQ